MNEPKEDVFEFPCRFPIKAMGGPVEGFETLVCEIVAQHVEPAKVHEVQSRESRAGSYLAVTVTFTAESREQLDALYKALSSHPRVKMVI